MVRNKTKQNKPPQNSTPHAHGNKPKAAAVRCPGHLRDDTRCSSDIFSTVTKIPGKIAQRRKDLSCFTLSKVSPHGHLTLLFLSLCAVTQHRDRMWCTRKLTVLSGSVRMCEDGEDVLDTTLNTWYIKEAIYTSLKPGFWSLKGNDNRMKSKTANRKKFQKAHLIRTIFQNIGKT